MKNRVAVALGLVLLSAPAAADEPFKWTGFYVGAHAGQGWGSWDGTLTYDPGTGPMPGVFDPANRSMDATGWLGGGQIGFNYRTGQIVWGLEVDASWTNAEGDGSFNTVPGPPPAGVNWAIKTQLDALGTVRGRLGFLAGDSLLLYGTGGLALGRTSADLVVRQCCGFPDDVTAKGSATENHIGWTAGGGLEWALGRSWSLKTEYLFVDLGSASYRLAGKNFISDIPHTTDSFPADLTFHTIRLGVNYKFGAD